MPWMRSWQSWKGKKMFDEVYTKDGKLVAINVDHVVMLEDCEGLEALTRVWFANGHSVVVKKDYAKLLREWAAYIERDWNGTGTA